MPVINEIDQLDVAKIHAEINQLRNQQFLITIAAISFFGVSAAWLLPDKTLLNNSTHIVAAGFSFALTIGLLFTMGLLFFWLTRLNNMIARLSTYLVARSLSNWEVLHSRFLLRHPKTTSQRGIMAMIFLLLGLASVAIPFSLVYFGPYDFNSTAPIQAQTWYLLLILVAIFYFGSVSFLGFRSTTEDRVPLVQHWKSVTSATDA